MLKMNEIKNWDKKAIEGKIDVLKSELFNFKMQRVTSGLEKPHKVKDNKKDIRNGLGGYAMGFSILLGNKNCRHKSQGNKKTIGVKIKTADMKENRMHILTFKNQELC